MSVLESVAREIEDTEALDRWADFAREKTHAALVAPDAVDSLLGGDWLGHRVHPVAAQAPLGAWMMATLLDLTGAERHEAAVDTLLLTGIVAALPTAITGAHDLGTTSGAATRVALVHAATMYGTLGLFTASWWKRRRGDRRRARRLAVAGTVVAGAGAYLGGHLTYRLAVGVRP